MYLHLGAISPSAAPLKLAVIGMSTSPYQGPIDKKFRDGGLITTKNGSIRTSQQQNVQSILNSINTI